VDRIDDLRAAIRHAQRFSQELQWWIGSKDTHHAATCHLPQQAAWPWLTRAYGVIAATHNAYGFDPAQSLGGAQGHRPRRFDLKQTLHPGDVL
jgi:hypothetical protein